MTNIDEEKESARQCGGGEIALLPRDPKRGGKIVFFDGWSRYRLVWQGRRYETRCYATLAEVYEYAREILMIDDLPLSTNRESLIAMYIALEAQERHQQEACEISDALDRGTTKREALDAARAAVYADTGMQQIFGLDDDE